MFASTRQWPGNHLGPPILPAGGNGSMGFDFDGPQGWNGGGAPPNLITWYQRTNQVVNLFQNNEVRHHLANVRLH